MAKADTGTSQHYFKNTDPAIINKLQKVPHITDIQLPDNSTIETSHVGILLLHQSLANRAKQVQILPKLTNTSLLSIGQLCDDNCTALFLKHNLHVFKKNQLVLKGIQNYLDGLWDVTLPQHDNINHISPRAVRNAKTAFLRRPIFNKMS